MKVYLIGSLRNPKIPAIANELRAAGHEVFDDWFAAGEFADTSWQAYEKGRGHTFAEALDGYAANHVFEYDRFHLERAEAVVLALPAGKSGHLEFGWAARGGALAYVLLEEEPERFDVMHRFADGVFSSLDVLIEALAERRSWRMAVAA